MGYYSSATLCLFESDFLRIVSRARAVGEEAYGFLTNATDIDVLEAAANGDRVLAVSWSGVKWYRDFAEVRLIHDWMDENTGERPFKFIRIGEDFEDMEVIQSDDYMFDGYIEVERRIEYGYEVDRNVYPYSFPDIPDDPGEDGEDLRVDGPPDAIFDLLT